MQAVAKISAAGGVIGLVLALLVPVEASAQQAAGSGADPCQKDANRFCKDAVPDEDKIAACLKANQSKLSPTCRKSFETRLKAKGM